MPVGERRHVAIMLGQLHHAHIKVALEIDFAEGGDGFLIHGVEKGFVQAVQQLSWQLLPTKRDQLQLVRPET